MIIGETENIFVYFNLDRGESNSLERDCFIISINGTNGPIYKKINTFRFKNN